jgi:hypothetical protein
MQLPPTERDVRSLLHAWQMRVIGFSSTDSGGHSTPGGSEAKLASNLKAVSILKYLLSGLQGAARMWAWVDTLSTSGWLHQVSSWQKSNGVVTRSVAYVKMILRQNPFSNLKREVLFSQAVALRRSPLQWPPLTGVCTVNTAEASVHLAVELRLPPLFNGVGLAFRSWNRWGCAGGATPEQRAPLMAAPLFPG